MPWRENEGKANNAKGSTPEDRRFIYVYRLAIDARPKRGDGVAGRKYPSLLEDFQTAAASMAHKRHLASTARGFYCFCLTPSIRKLIRSICLIRGRETIPRTGNSPPGEGYRCGSRGAFLYCQRQLFCFLGA